MEAQKLIAAMTSIAEGKTTVDSARISLGLFAGFAARQLSGTLMERALALVQAAADFLSPWITAAGSPRNDRGG